jgi:CRP/FNR family transcriptional regulator/CRP/FNR family cyclic AMP-dependent transcriptional regulator
MAQREQAILAVLRHVALFRPVPDEQLHGLCALLRERHYRKGTIIFQEGDQGDSLYIICKGRVRIYLAGPDGREATVRVYRPYQTFGEFAVLDGAPRSANAAALEEVFVLSLYRAEFLGLLRANFDMVLHMFAQLTERARYTTDYSGQLAFLSRPGRIAATLLRLAGTESQGDGTGQLDITQQELADFTNTTREWVNHILRDFADARLISVERRTITILDREGLRRRVV